MSYGLLFHLIRTRSFKFYTVNTGLLHKLPGTTLANIVQRGNYDSLKYASLRLGELDCILHIFLTTHLYTFSMALLWPSFAKDSGGTGSIVHEIVESFFFPANVFDSPALSTE